MGSKKPRATPSAQMVYLQVALLHAVASAHPLDSALAVDDALLTGVERVALAAYFHSQSGFGGAGLVHVATGASHCAGKKLGMYFCFHVIA